MKYARALFPPNASRGFEKNKGKVLYSLSTMDIFMFFPSFYLVHYLRKKYVVTMQKDISRITQFYRYFQGHMIHDESLDMVFNNKKTILIFYVDLNVKYCHLMAFPFKPCLRICAQIFQAKLVRGFRYNKHLTFLQNPICQRRQVSVKIDNGVTT